MGIRGLTKYLRGKARQSFQPARGLWAIDTSCILYRARGEGLSLVTVVASLIVRIRKAGGEPIFVFDGSTPAAKTRVVEERRTARVATTQEITALRTELAERPDRPERERADLEVRIAALQKKAPVIAGGDREAVKQLLHAAGVLFVTANGEADDLLGYLARMGIVEGVISSDMDMLARGVGRLVTPDTADCSVLSEVSLARVLGLLKLTYGQFVAACQLMGSDYTPAGFCTVDPPTAIATVRQPGFVLASQLAEGAAMLRGDGVLFVTLLSEKQRGKWLAGGGVPEPVVLAEFAERERWPRDWLTVLDGAVLRPSAVA